MTTQLFHDWPIHHMTTMKYVSNIFNANTAHKSVFRTVKAFLLYSRNVILSHI